MEKIKKLIVSGLGTGYLPIAPGTWGSGAVAGIFLLTAWGCSGRWYCISAVMLAVALAASIACVALGSFAQRAYGKKDPSQCTLDEWAGQAVTYFLLPPFLFPEAITWRGWIAIAAVGFLTFRVMDIIKPPPARSLEKLPDGWGVLLDDLAASIYANIAAQLLLRLWLLGIL
jgi:phosphatidylglycerophosphatase A